MKPQEMEILNLLGEIANKFAELPRQHPADLDEATVHIHALQNMLMARYTTREFPWLFNSRKSDEDEG